MSSAAEAIRVAVVGATGYAGAELIRYLARHPGVRLVAATSEQSAGKALADVLPSVRQKLDLRLAAFDPAAIASVAQVAFTALPQESLCARTRSSAQVSQVLPGRSFESYGRLACSSPTQHIMITDEGFGRIA